MLKKIRIALAAVFWIAIVALFLDSTGTIQTWLGWMAKIQFLPAVLALNVVVVVGLVILTLVFGRVYCSVICPLGITQDIVDWLRRKIGPKKATYRFSYRKENRILRYGVLIIWIALFIAGLGSVFALLAPYSAFGRIVSSIAHPATLWTSIIAAVTLFAIVALSWWDGRIYCNTICPVGTTLGLLSRFALFGPVIDTDKCRGCGLCGKACKSSCIDTAAHKVDYSRCVDCMNCIGICKEGAVRYGFRYGRKSAPKAAAAESCDAGRRAFMVGGALALGTLSARAQDVKLDGGLAPVVPKKSPERAAPIVPPGAGSIKHIDSRCTACQLCISACPNKVLRPSSDLSRLMKPELCYEKGFCRPECTLCSEICPTGAIEKISREEKTATQIGRAVVDIDACIVFSKGEECFNCIRHCPARAVVVSEAQTSDGRKVKVPSVDQQKCIGCGECEYLCPVRPVSAIHVDGNETHHTI